MDHPAIILRYVVIQFFIANSLIEEWQVDLLMIFPVLQLTRAMFCLCKEDNNNLLRVCNTIIIKYTFSLFNRRWQLTVWTSVYVVNRIRA